MIYDHRTYVCKPGMIKTHLELYQKHGFAPHMRHLGRPVMFATTEVGNINSYVHVWAYKDLAERTAKRAALWADPEWTAYVKKSHELSAVVHQENKILVATEFSLAP